MKSPFRYPGGKSRRAAREAIFSHFPKKIGEYREPFVGGGGIYFGLDRMFERAWINDMHAPLIRCYQEMQSDAEGFARACREIEIHRSATTRGCVGERLFRSFCDQGYDVSGLGFLFLNRTIWAGRVILGPRRKESRLYYSNPGGWHSICNRKGMDSLEGVGEYLQGTRITCGDYAPLLTEPGDNVWAYLDPPYVRDTELTSGDKQYEHGFTMQDHERLWDEMAHSPHQLVVSYDDHEYVRAKAKEHGFSVHEARWTYSGTGTYRAEADGEQYDPTEGNEDRKKKVGRELILVRA